MNHASGLWCCSTPWHGPSAHFFHSSGEVSLQAKQSIACADHAAKAWLFHAHIGNKISFFFILYISDFCYSLCADGNNFCALFSSINGELLRHWVVPKTIFGNVGHIHRGLKG